MFKFIKNVFKRKDKGLVLPFPVPPEEHVHLPSGCEPIDTVLNLQQIPSTNITIGNISKAVESPLGDRIEITLEKPVRAGCGHIIRQLQSHITPQQQIHGLEGTCTICYQKYLHLSIQQIISDQQLILISSYCTKCQSYCTACLNSSICLKCTCLVPDQYGVLQPVCATCYDALTNHSLLQKIANFLR